MAFNTAIIAGLVLIIAGGAGGFYLGSQSGREAKELLEKEIENSKKASALHEQTEAGLRAQMEENNKKFEEDRREQTRRFEEERKSLKSALADEAARLRELKRSRDDLQKRKTKLEATLAGATSPEEKAKYLAEIAALNAQIDDLVKKEAVASCAFVPVPKDLLERLQGAR
jgi:DNA repair exonuclease SbcCD ATPase subunit